MRVLDSNLSAYIIASLAPYIISNEDAILSIEREILFSSLSFFSIADRLFSRSESL